MKDGILTCNGTGDRRWISDGRRQVDGPVMRQNGRLQGWRGDVRKRFDQETLRWLAGSRPSVTACRGGHQRPAGQQDAVRNALSNGRAEEDNPAPSRFRIIMKLQRSQFSRRSGERLTK